MTCPRVTRAPLFDRSSSSKTCVAKRLRLGLAPPPPTTPCGEKDEPAPLLKIRLNIRRMPESGVAIEKGVPVPAAAGVPNATGLPLPLPMLLPVALLRRLASKLDDVGTDDDIPRGVPKSAAVPKETAEPGVAKLRCRGTGSGVLLVRPPPKALSPPPPGTGEPRPAGTTPPAATAAAAAAAASAAASDNTLTLVLRGNRRVPSTPLGDGTAVELDVASALVSYVTNFLSASKDAEPRRATSRLPLCLMPWAMS